ncbi:hypothetical protein D0867_16518 [Hortaea werneckii]|uniref:Secondary thiamine-phosphate synthase enzyme n=2 Tax=Hortaea werneckii TaxID=91943 RepID=A0A3M6WKL7_HORWE|nr:hypothetical protein D0867_16518 [Hortaea werneckii]
MPFETSLRNTVIFLAVFILAFFPSAFHLLLKPILLPFELLGGDQIPEAQNSLPSCGCCPPPSCNLPPHPVHTEIKPDESKMSWFQKQIMLPSKSKGTHLVTDHVVRDLPEIKNYKVGLLHLFVQHTSCGLSLNENFDEDVRDDMTDALDRVAPEDRKGNMYRHSAEGLDDMPAHIKSVLVGPSITVPITNGRLNTGTWQGIYYLEFRASKHSRKVVATIQGEKQ